MDNHSSPPNTQEGSLSSRETVVLKEEEDQSVENVTLAQANRVYDIVSDLLLHSAHLISGV